MRSDFSGSYIDAYYTYVNPNANIPQYALPDGSNVCPATALVGEPPHPVCAVIPPGVTQLDAKLPKTPKYKLSLWPQYDLTLPNSATVRFLADYTYTAEMFNDALNTPQLRRPPTHMIDATISTSRPTACTTWPSAEPIWPTTVTSPSDPPTTVRARWVALTTSRASGICS